MGTNTLANKAAGDTIASNDPNELQQALNGDFVGRNTSGVPTSGQNLGTAAFPWGTVRANGLVIGGSSVDVSQISAPSHRVTAGVSRATSNQPAWIDPAGVGNGLSLVVDGTPTSLVFDVAGTSFTLSADLTESSLTAGPSSNNTALVNDTDATDQASTKTWGEPDSEKQTITIDAAASNVTAEIGNFVGLKINDGTNDEFFIGFIKSATEITQCRRGFFYNDSIAPVNRIAFANNDTITLMSLGYVFLDSNLTTVDVTYNTPSYSFTQPSGPATGDYWFDIQNSLWKRFDGASFVTVTRTFIGWVILDDTDAVGARSVDLDARYRNDINLPLEVNSTAIIRGLGWDSLIHVAGNEIRFVTDRPSWNITTDLAASADLYDATEQASTFYYLYLSDDGEEIISDIEPYRRGDLAGFYHPHNPWRCVGNIFNDSSSDIISVSQYLNIEFNKLGHGSSIGRTTTQSIPGATTTPVVLNVAKDDPLGWGDLTNGEIRIMIPGYYQVNVACSFEANATGGRVVIIGLNGVNAEAGNYGTASGIQSGGTICTRRKLDLGDLLTMRVFQTSGGALDTRATFNEVYLDVTYLGAIPGLE